MKLIQGAFAGNEIEVIADHGSTLDVVVEILGRRVELTVRRDDTDAPPAETETVCLPNLNDALDTLLSAMPASALDGHIALDAEDQKKLEALGPAAADLLTLYKRLGGTNTWQGFWQGNELVRPAAAAETRELMNRLQQEGTFYRWMTNEWWNPAWLPFLDNHSYDTFCVDLEGMWGGPAGQVIKWSKDSPERTVLAPSLSAWLGVLAVALSRGLIHWSEDGGFQEASAFAELRSLWDAALPDYPKQYTARSRKDVEGHEPPPRPPVHIHHERSVDYEITQQWWAPDSAVVHALAFVPSLGLLAIGQSNVSGRNAGLSLVDPESKEVRTILLDENGSAKELAWAGEALVIRRRRHSINEVLVHDADGLRVLRSDFPICSRQSIGVGHRYVVIGTNPVEIWPLKEGPVRQLAARGQELLVALSKDDKTVAIAQSEQPIRWFDVAMETNPTKTQQPVLARSLCFGLDDDLWVAANRNLLRFDLKTGQPRLHETVSTPFCLALDRVHERLAVAGYSGVVTVLDARSGELLASDKTHDGRVYGLAWNDAGTRLWSGCEGGQIVERTLGVRTLG